MWRLYLAYPGLLVGLSGIGFVVYKIISGFDFTGIIHYALTSIIVIVASLRLLAQYREYKQIEEVNKLVNFAKGALKNGGINNKPEGGSS